MKAPKRWSDNPSGGGFATPVTHLWRCVVTMISALLWVLPTLAAEVTAVRLWQAPDHTRIVLDLSEAADFTHFALENPDRLVLDLRSSRLSTTLSQ